MPAEIAYIGLGSNLDGPSAQLDAAREALGALPESRLEACSSLYRTAPVGPPQPDFVNAVCRLRTGLTARALLARLLEIERAQGRVRGVRFGARVIDLDLLLLGGQRLMTTELELPHPRMHERAFVLAPLTELAPALEIPGLGPAATWLGRCAGQRVERMPPQERWPSQGEGNDGAA